ncbi:MAG: type II toxin-antitoxin system HicB family antitoxin [Acidobacteriota bacterium]
MCKFTIAFDREDDGRFIAEVQEIPGALTDGETQAEAKAKVQAVALRSLAENILLLNNLF